MHGRDAACLKAAQRFVVTGRGHPISEGDDQSEVWSAGVAGRWSESQRYWPVILAVISLSAGVR